MSKNNQFIIWALALVLGAGFGCIGSMPLDEFFKFTAAVFTRLFQFTALPVIALSVITALSGLGSKKNAGRIFGCMIRYTLITTFAAAVTGLILYILFTPETLPAEFINQGAAEKSLTELSSMSYYEHILSVIPNNLVQPFLSANVMSVLLIAAAAGIGLSIMPESENKTALIKVITGLQELLFTLIRGLINIMPIGIMAFSAQLASQLASGAAIGALGHYTALVIGGNLIQIFVIIPLFLLFKKLNPFYIFKKMLPALAAAFFTKSSAAALPVTISCAEKNLNIKPEISRFVLSACAAVNMNGCAAFILITSLFVMQNAGFEINVLSAVLWVFISVFAAIGNAGVPMGCYFLTLSLMSSIGAPITLLGIILPIYAVIDMIETAENVWSDSAVCAAVNKDEERF